MSELLQRVFEFFCSHRWVEREAAKRCIKCGRQEMILKTPLMFPDEPQSKWVRVGP